MHVAPKSSVCSILLSLQFASGLVKVADSVGVRPLRLRLRLRLRFPWTAAVLCEHLVCEERSPHLKTRQQQQDTTRKQNSAMMFVGIEHDKLFR